MVLIVVVVVLVMMVFWLWWCGGIRDNWNAQTDYNAPDRREDDDLNGDNDDGKDDEEGPVTPGTRRDINSKRDAGDNKKSSEGHLGDDHDSQTGWLVATGAPGGTPREPPGNSTPETHKPAKLY